MQRRGASEKDVVLGVRPRVAVSPSWRQFMAYRRSPASKRAVSVSSCKVKLAQTLLSGGASPGALIGDVLEVTDVFEVRACAFEEWMRRDGSIFMYKVISIDAQSACAMIVRHSRTDRRGGIFSCSC